MLPSTQEVNKVSAGEGTNYYRCGKRLSMSHDLSRVLQLWKKRTHSGRLASPTPGPIYPKPQPKKSATTAKGPSSTVGVDQEVERTYWLKQIRSEPGRPLEIEVRLEGKPLMMEVDTGAGVSLVSEKTFQMILPSHTTQATRTQLRTYSGEAIPVVGKVDVEVQYQGQQANLLLIVVEGDGPSLFGCDWLSAIRLDWKSTNMVKSKRLASVLDKHQVLFADGLGTQTGYEVKIIVEPGTQPPFCKARPVPYALQGQVNEELERLEREGIIPPVQFADWQHLLSQ